MLKYYRFLILQFWRSEVWGGSQWAESGCRQDSAALCRRSGGTCPLACPSPETGCFLGPWPSLSSDIGPAPHVASSPCLPANAFKDLRDYIGPPQMTRITFDVKVNWLAALMPLCHRIEHLHRVQGFGCGHLWGPLLSLPHRPITDAKVFRVMLVTR